MKEMPTVGKLQCSQCFAVEWFGQLPGKHYVELGLATATAGSFYVMGIGNCSLEITVLTYLWKIYKNIPKAHFWNRPNIPKLMVPL